MTIPTGSLGQILAIIILVVVVVTILLGLFTLPIAAVCIGGLALARLI